MYRFTYENQGSSNFLIYQLREDEKLDQMALGMMNQNKIPNLLPVSYTQIDSHRYLRYSGLSLSTLKSVMSGMVTRERLLTIFESICNGVRSSEEYLLEGNFFVLDTEYMYVDSASGRTSLVYLPILNQEESADYAAFFKKIITDAITDPSEDGTYITRLLYYLNSTENFSLAEFYRRVKELKTPSDAGGREAPHHNQYTKKEPERKKNVEELQKEQSKPVQKVAPKSAQKTTEKAISGQVPDGKQQKEAPQKQKTEKKAGSDRTVKNSTGNYGFAIPGQEQAEQDGQISSGENSQEKMSMLYLLRNFSGENLEKFKKQKPEKGKHKKQEEPAKKKGTKDKKKAPSLTLVSLDPARPMKLTVNKDVYNIGRRETNDTVMTGMKKISREHCSIVREAGAYYVIDRNSTFGTVVDGISCVSGKKSGALHDNSIIELPDIRFRVELR